MQSERATLTHEGDCIVGEFTAELILDERQALVHLRYYRKCQAMHRITQAGVRSISDPRT